LRTLLICDLDNTLYDWAAYFVPSFYALVDHVVELTGCDRETLLDEFRTVHRLHQDSEHPFALLETATIKRLYAHLSRDQVRAKLDPAFHTFNRVRRKTLTLFPRVIETLDALRTANVSVVAHTEAKLHSVMYRLKALNIIDYFAGIYCLEPSGESPPRLPALYQDYASRIRMLPSTDRKPSAGVLKLILFFENADAREAAYIGDSITRDVIMANDANVYSIWAKYGASRDPRLFEQLVRISHWSDADIARETQLLERAATAHSDYTAERGFWEVEHLLGSKSAAT
jgi:FMN phosphatase YigB (HAD superfamily)